MQHIQEPTSICAISNAACLERGVSQKRGGLQKRVPLSHAAWLCLAGTRGAPYADDEIV